MRFEREQGRKPGHLENLPPNMGNIWDFFSERKRGDSYSVTDSVFCFSSLFSPLPTLFVFQI